MRSLLVFAPLMLATGCPGDTDEGGCPLDLLEAVGTDCTDEGKQCGEISTCEACTADPTGCAYIECASGVWTEVPLSDFCDG